MGYTTDFVGSFKLDRPLSPEHYAYLVEFGKVRHMRRNPNMLGPDRIAEQAGLLHGPEGAYYVAGGGPFGQDHDRSIIDYNEPPHGQPGLWCQWVPTGNRTAIEHDGGEKFYYYVEWIQYLIQHFFGPWGYKLNGSVQWSGEDPSDVGTIVIKDNVVDAKSVEEEREETENRVEMLENTLREILKFKTNPIRRPKTNVPPNPERPGEKARKGNSPDWVKTKEQIFEIAKRALEK